MNLITKGLGQLRQSMTPFKYINNNLNQLIAFQSTLPQDFDKQVSDDYEKDMPDQTLINPYRKEKRQCILCKYNIQVDYKNVQLLSQFVSPYTGRLYDKHITGLCEKQQKVLKREHSKAIRFSLISPAYRDPKYGKDPRLFDPTKPQRPNPY